MDGSCSIHEREREREREKNNVYRALVRKTEGKRLLGRPRHRWEDKIKIERIKMGGEDWIHLAEIRDQWRAIMNTVINLYIP
jgi:hypothetical protein